MSAGVTASFFSLIHPPTGWRCLFTLPDRRHFWFDNPDDLARVALHLDSKGRAVFHACASFTGKERKQEHVQSIRCLWFDLDAGPGKPYGDAGAAYRALEAWRSTVQMPPALVVVSGGGLHAYWPLRDPLGTRQWRGAADRLRALAAQHGLQIDPGSTIDAARILRPPGTHNRKLFDASGKKIADVGGAPRAVRMGPLVGPYDLAALPLAGEPPMTSLGAAPDFMQGVTSDAAILNVGGVDRPADPDRVAEHCAQVRRLRDSHGVLPEPEWYAILGVLAHCGEPGRVRAHAWSRGDVRYTLVDTDAKLDQYLANADGPTKCSRLGQLVVGPCLTCPFSGKITSPVQLGRELPAAVTAPAPAAAGLTLPALPVGFGWAGMQLVCQRKPSDEDPTPYHVISSYPIVVEALEETERSHTVSAAFRSWEPMKQGWRDFSLNLGEIVGQAGHGRVADHGVVVPQKRWGDFVRYANAATVEHRGSKPYGTRYEQFGWKANGAPGFVLGGEFYRAGVAVKPIHGTAELARRGELMAPSGEVTAWSAAANALVAGPGLEGQAFLALCAFAAPLYHFTGELGVTFAHASTRATARGKTTALQIAWTVWGGRDATSLTERDTMVAKFITMGTLCHLPVIFDELRFRDSDETKHYVLQGTIGRDKQRAKQEGGLRTDHLSWSTVHISAANISLMDAVRADNSEVAQAARIFEFSLTLPPGLKTTEGDRLRRVLEANRGTAGRVFIQYVLDHYAETAAVVQARMAQYEQTLKAGPEERYILRLLACVDAAAAIVAETELLAIDPQAIMAWALATQRANALRLASEGAVDAAATLSQLVNDFIPHLLTVEAAHTSGKPSQVNAQINDEFRGPLWARFERHSRKLLLEIGAVRKWLQKHHHSFTETQKELTELKILSESRVRRTLGAGTTLALGQVWCWQLDGNHPLLVDLIDPPVPAVEGNVVALRGTA